MKSPPIWTVMEYSGRVNMLRLARKMVFTTMIACTTNFLLERVAEGCVRVSTEALLQPVNRGICCNGVEHSIWAAVIRDWQTPWMAMKGDIEVVALLILWPELWHWA